MYLVEESPSGLKITSTHRFSVPRCIRKLLFASKTKENQIVCKILMVFGFITLEVMLSVKNHGMN